MKEIKDHDKVEDDSKAYPRQRVKKRGLSWQELGKGHGERGSSKCKDH
jgi:hypothetical protein